MASFLGVRVPFTADGTAFKRGLANMRKDSEGFAGSLKSMFKDAFSFAGGIGIASGVGKLIDGVKSLGRQAIKGAADMEQLSISLEVLTGSAASAQKLLRELAQFADTTPFRLSDLVKGTKTLLGFGVTLDDVMPTIRMLGDVAAGDAEKLERLTLAYGQITSAGRLMGQDLLQLINAGFNPLQNIAAKTGETMLELRKRMEAGGIGVDEVKGAFVEATSEGGRFFKMMERQGKTTLGLWSTLSDAWAKIMRTIGTPINDWLKPWIEKATATLSKFGEAFQEAVKGGEAIFFLKQGLAAAAESFGDALLSAAIKTAAIISDAAKEIPGVKQAAEGGGAIARWMKAIGEQGESKQAAREKILELKRRGFEFDGMGNRILKRPENREGGGYVSPNITAVQRFAGTMERLGNKAQADRFAAAAFQNAESGGVGAGGGGVKNLGQALENAVRNAFGFRIGGTPGAIVGDRPEMKQGEIPSIIASELATMGLGGRAAGFGGFDPLVEQMKNSVDYQRRMAEYLQQIASKSGAYEPVA